MATRKRTTTTTTDTSSDTGSAADAAPEGVTTLEDVRAARPPESGPSDTEAAVTLTGPGGTKVSAPKRMSEALKSQGFK